MNYIDKIYSKIEELCNSQEEFDKYFSDVYNNLSTNYEGWENGCYIFPNGDQIWCVIDKDEDDYLYIALDYFKLQNDGNFTMEFAQYNHIQNKNVLYRFREILIKKGNENELKRFNNTYNLIGGK